MISGLQIIKSALISARTHRPMGQHRVQRQTHTHAHLAPDKGARAIPVKHTPTVKAEHARPRSSGTWTACC